MIDESHHRKLENMMHSAPIVKMVGARVKISEGRAEITLPVKKDLYLYPFPKGVKVRT
jgi:acyl-coenzyme A thioesterase PaaI-like protein